MGTPIRILHLEDNPNDAELVLSMLTAEGMACEVVRVETRQDFEAALEQGGFDLILSDFTLPSYAGRSAIMLAREKRPDVPFVFVSGTIGEDAAIEALQHGATDYILKGRLTRLGPAVRRALQEKEDRSARTRATEAMQQSEAMKSAVLHSALDAIITIDHNGLILEFNPAAEATFGYTRETVLDKSMAELIIPPSLREKHYRGLAHYLATGEGPVLDKRIEITAMRADGTEFPVELAIIRIRREGAPIFTAFIRDISERKRAEHYQAAQLVVSTTLAESRTLGEAAPKILQAIADAIGWELGEIWRVDHLTNVLRCKAIWHAPSVSAEAFIVVSRTITFSPGVGLPGRVWSNGEPAWIPDVVTDPNSPRASVAAQSGLHGAFGFPIRSGNQIVGVIEFFSRDVRQPDMDLLRMMADVGGKIGQFVQREEIEGQLIQAQKMEAIGQLTSGIAHDFNNMLTVIIGYSELMLQSLGPDDPGRANVEAVKQAGERASLLTKQLLAFSRKQVLQPQVLDLNAVLTNLEQMLQRVINENIYLVNVLAPALGTVQADPSQIEQVVMNLAVNARDAMPLGGKLTIETANVELDDAYASQHHPVQPGAYVMLAVSDTGSGMDAETQKHIFEPFFTTKEVGKGTGLGLSTVYGIVKQSGGYIWVYSEPKQGTTFKIYLPRVDVPAQAVEPTRETSRPLRGSETILVVEDDAAIRSLTRQILAACGYTVLEAHHGKHAVQISEQHAGPIHLLMTDVVMPELSGPETAGRLTSVRPDLKVLFLSGYANEAVHRQGVLAPGTNFLPKPFTPIGLARKVRDVLDAPGNCERS